MIAHPLPHIVSVSNDMSTKSQPRSRMAWQKATISPFINIRSRFQQILAAKLPRCNFQTDPVARLSPPMTPRFVVRLDPCLQLVDFAKPAANQTARK
jgi:hypothetical protein